MTTKKKKKLSIRQKKAIENTVENHGNVGKAMVDAGYSPATAKNPKNLTESKGWTEYMEEHLSDADLAKKHEELLNSSSLGHMTFPPETKKKKDNIHQGLTDLDIEELLLGVNCKVQRIVHGELTRHVYFWSADNKARKDALDMAYKLKGSYAPEKKIHGHIDLDNPFNDNQASTIAKRITGRKNSNGDTPSKKKSN